MLWSFIKNHLKQKIIVFLSSCKQVKYVYEIFCKLRPGTSLLALYGTLHQDRRISIYNDFVKRSNVVLFATDIASRGLDFPSVNWVIQLDCPENVTQYIHRAGRSARNKTRGECLLVLMPTEEEGMIEELNQKFLTVKRIQIDPKKLFSPRAKIEAFLAQNPELKASAQRAFVAYIKSVFLMKNKKVFNVLALNFDAYAKSLGLVVTPRVRFLERYLKKQNNSISGKIDTKGYTESDEASDDDNAHNDICTEKKSMKSHKKHEEDGILFKASDCNTDSDDDGDDLLKIKRVNHEINQNDEADNDNDLPPPVLRKKEKLVTKAALAKKVLKKKLQMNEKVKFDEDGHEIVDPRKQLQSDLAKKYESKDLTSGGIDINMAKQLLQEEDKFDKQRFRELVKERRKAIKKKLKKRNDKYKDEEEDYEVSGGDQFDSEDDEGSVDLSWLPDPSKLYSKESNSPIKLKDAELSSSHTHLKRNHLGEERCSEGDIDELDFEKPLEKKFKITSKLNLNDAEIIAAQLLGNSM